MHNGNLTVNDIYSVTDRSVCLFPMSNEINIFLLCVSMHMGVCVCVYVVKSLREDNIDLWWYMRKRGIDSQAEIGTDGTQVYLTQDLFTLKFSPTKEKQYKLLQNNTQKGIHVLNLVEL